MASTKVEDVNKWLVLNSMKHVIVRADMRAGYKNTQFMLGVLIATFRVVEQILLLSTDITIRLSFESSSWLSHPVQSTISLTIFSWVVQARIREVIQDAKFIPRFMSHVIYGFFLRNDISDTYLANNLKRSDEL
jgi:hypothetical protein